MTTLTDAAAENMNRAANDILEALEPLPDTGVRDIINLMVNTTAHYLDFPDATLAEAIEATYNEDPETVLDWCKEG